MKKDSYCVATTKESKTPFLGKVTSVDEKHVNIILEKNRAFGVKTLSIPHKNIIADLGTKPHPGKVFGLDTANLYRKTIDHDFWGPINFFISMEKEDSLKLKKALDNTAAYLTKLGLDQYCDNLHTDIKAKQGKWAGKYIHSGKKEVPNRIWYAPEWANGKQAVLEEIIYHEFGHVIRFNGLSSKQLRAKWQTLFQTTIQPVVISKDDVQDMLEKLKEGCSAGEVTLPTFLKTLVEESNDPDETTLQVKAVLRWMKQIHRVSIKELSVLWDTNRMKSFQSLWPKGTVDTNKLKPLVTEYATVNVEELFAECFALYCMKKKLPNSALELLETSLSLIKGN